MGKMTLQIAEQYTNPPGEGKLGSVRDIFDSCTTSWSVSAKTTTSAWVEWIILGMGGLVVKDIPPTINGQTITSPTDFTATIDRYRSANENQNDTLTQIIFTIKDVEGGTTLDTITLSRHHSGLVC